MHPDDDPHIEAADDVPPPGHDGSAAGAAGTAQRPWQQRRKYQVMATVAAAAIAATAGVLVAQHTRQRHSQMSSGVPVGAGATPGTPAAGPPAGTTLPHTGATGATTPSVATGGTAAGAPDSTGAGRTPATEPPTVTKALIGNVPATVTSSGSMPKEHHTLRVVSARADLTGQGELAWAADAGTPVRDARCTQNFRFNPGSRVGERPTMVLCWRTSPQKSVYVIAVDIDHRPSAQAAATTIDRVWSTLG
ncbi:MAG: hypothetical protein QOI74_3892 [Micromonosporaceae bacterium]|jgi:hypothetical protein|nr:hypothetical protein [Micromonosporaceae bacterium]